MKHFDSSFSATLPFRVTAQMVQRFAALTGDRSSLHTDEEFARRSIYRRPVVHGMLPVAFLMLCPELQRTGSPARLAALSGQFSGPAYAGDELVLAIQPAGSTRPQPEVAFDFRIERPATKEVLTTGNVVLVHGALSEPESSTNTARPTLLSSEVAMRRLETSGIAKGDRDGFEFAVTAAHLESFRSLLLEGVAAAGSRRAGGLESADLLGVMLLSTLVGMRVPGELATFLDFAVTVTEPLRAGVAYRLEGKVAHVSRGTNIVKTDVTIVPAKGGRGAIHGRVATLVNSPAPTLKTIRDLRGATDLGLRDKVVLITGASRGIGETTAKLFALFGAKVIVNYRRSQQDAARIVSEIVSEGGSAIALQADVADLAQLRPMVAAAVAHYGGVDVLVNNAVRDFRSIAYADLDWDEIQADLDVTVKGAFSCSKLVVPHMLARGGGKIVNISSIYVEDPPVDQLKYVVSKAALEGLARGLAAELADRNIQVNTVVPSFVDTEMASRMHEGIRKRKAQVSPMKRNASPEDVAHAVVFLASSFSAYTTGQRILVTGGGAPYL